jgi:hypothetical protein
MSRQSLSRLFAFWNWSKPRRSLAAAPAWREIPVRISMASPGTVRPPFTPEQLDELHGMLSTGCDDARTDRPSWRSGGKAGSAGRQAPLVNVVDRAIAEIASPRGRRKRARW